MNQIRAYQTELRLCRLELEFLESIPQDMKGLFCETRCEELRYKIIELVKFLQKNMLIK